MSVKIETSHLGQTITVVGTARYPETGWTENQTLTGQCTEIMLALDDSPNLEPRSARVVVWSNTHGDFIPVRFNPNDENVDVVA